VLATLEARNFRNLAPLGFAPGAGSHLLLGDNGAGKTSVLEAVYALATTRSLRTSQIADCARHGAGGFHLAGEVEGDARVRLEVGWRAGNDGGERHRAVNGSQTTLAEHLEVLPVVAWTAGEAEVLTGAPALRRRFLDRGVVGSRPAALAALTRYRQTLRQKRELLAAGRVDEAELATWNAMLAAAGAAVMALRRAYAERLAARLAEVWAEAALPFPEVELTYRPSPATTGGKADEGAILARLHAAADQEVRRAQPLLGPHRDDLEVLWGGHPVRATVSAGERKALSLLLTAAHGRTLAAAGRDPVYLLDDLDAELAPSTLERVWQAFSPARQLLATSNRPAVWKDVALDRRSLLQAGILTPA
jgi:DNA replication and repair protein RecF